MANSLQDITNAWGNWMNKQYDGGVFRGGQGVSVSIRVDESSINGSSTAQTKSADHSYEIPLDVVPT